MRLRRPEDKLCLFTDTKGGAQSVSHSHRTGRVEGLAAVRPVRSTYVPDLKRNIILFYSLICQHWALHWREYSPGEHTQRRAETALLFRR